MRRRGTLRPQQGVQYADRLVVMLEDGVGGELAPVWADGSAEVESPGVVVRGLRSAGGRGPWVPRGCCGVVATGGTIGEFIHRAEMDRAEGEAILHGVVPTGVFSVAAAGHRAVIPDVRKRICAAGRIVLEHGVGAERALAAEGQLAEVRGRYTAIVLVIERLARARAVNGERIAGPGKAVVDDLGGGRVGEQAGLRIDARGSVEHNEPAGRKLLLTLDAKPRLRQVVRCDEESMLIAVSVHQRFAFIVRAVFR